MDDKIIGNIIELDHLDGNISQVDHLSGNLNSNGDEQTVYRGYSAYEVALQQGFEGSKDEWLRALVGPQGETGVSISDVRLNPDFTLTITLDNGTEFTTESIKGNKGDKGQKGDKGDKGDTGNGITFIRLNDDYSLTVFFSDGSYSNTTSVRGPQGEQGIQGIQGPKGDTGQRGPQGQQGIQGIQGPKGQTGPQGEAGPAFTYEDFTQVQLEGLRGPQGIQGPKGDKGQKGDTGQQGLQGIQGLKGDKGQIGPMGPQGPQGDPGDDYILTEQDKQDIANLVEVPVNDVQINGTSIIENGIAEIPFATSNAGGVVKIDSSLGIKINDTNKLLINRATTTQTKAGSDAARPIVPVCQHESVFYGLTKAAGVDMASSSNAVGTYTESAKSAISNMLNGAIQISGTDPTIVAKSGIRYVCGEVLSLDFTPSASGICDIMFTSGSTPTVLTLPNTVKMPEWFIIEANTTYEINIADGIYGAVTSWTL